jgi:hypothetical protein
MKSIKVLGMIAATALLTAACSGNGQKQSQQDVEEENTEVAVINRDSTIYGLCGEASAMNTLQLIIDSGDTITFNVTEAQEAGQVFGGYNIGDRMAVLPKLGSKNVARLVINQSALLGDWIMPNPLDGSSEMGISIKEGGIVEGIEQSSVIYKTWRIFNGKIEIQTQREGGGEEEEVLLLDLVMLGPDTLIMKDAEDTYNYGHPHEVKHRIDLKFEDDAETTDFNL